MENREILVGFIINNEKRNIELLFNKLRKGTYCEEYAIAREKLLVIEAAEEFNRKIADFYTDINELARKLFEEILSVKEATDFLCQLVKDSLKQEKRHSYEKAASFIDENITDNQLCVSSAAHYAGVTQSALVKLFVQNAGITPGDYIGKQRTERSLEFLRGNISVEKTATLVGYSSVESYIRAFKKHMGMTPGVWKRKYIFN